MRAMAGTPLSESMAIVSLVSLPDADTFLETVAMSSRSVPNVDAAPMAPFRAWSMSAPADTPAAARLAVMTAAWSNENTVPSTALLMDS